jgi:hypothetical protein
MSLFLAAAALLAPLAPLAQTPSTAPPASIVVPMPTTKFCPYVPGVVGQPDCIRSATVPVSVPAGTWVIRTETFDPDPEPQVDENVRIALGGCRFTTTALTAAVRDVEDTFTCTLTEPIEQISFLFAEPDDNRYRSVFLRTTLIEMATPPPTTTTGPPTTGPTTSVPPSTVPPTTTPPGPSTTTSTTPSTEPPGTVATTTTAPNATSTVVTTTTVATTTVDTTTTTLFAGPPTPPTATVPPPSTGGGDLPFTGADVDSLALFGVGLLALGTGTAGTAKGLRDRRR